MLQNLLARTRALSRRGTYIALAFLASLGVVFALPQTTQAFSIFDLLRTGAQVFQLSNLSDRQEVSLGGQINQQISRSVQIDNDRRLNDFVNRVGQRLVPASSRGDIPYTFQVVRDDSVNAFATMGGYVYMHTGLLAAAENEAEVASVMAHEIGHIAGRHAIKQMRERAIAQGVLTAAGLDDAAAVQIGVDLALNRPNSREDEYEADSLGLQNLTAAGYAPEGMVSFMRKLQSLSGGRSAPTFLSTHPATGDRVRALEAEVGRLPSRGGDGLDSQSYRQQIGSRL